MEPHSIGTLDPDSNIKIFLLYPDSYETNADPELGLYTYAHDSHVLFWSLVIMID